MKDVIHPYDRDLYSRLFLDCSQRQSMVMLAERVPDLPLLFHRCLISTDDILDHSVRRQRPKYEFESRFFAQEDLARIGVTREETPYETFAEARPLLMETVRRDGFAVVVGDVYYWPHCPEYRERHLTHTVTLREYHADGEEWSILDDNPASLLCAYRYPEKVIADGYDNGELRRIRYFTRREYNTGEAERGTAESFSALLGRYKDSLTLFSDIKAVLGSPWTAPERAIAALHDAFALHQGSRIGLRAYVRRAFGDSTAVSLLDRAVEQAAEVQNGFLLGKVTGTVDTDWTAAACRALAETEEALVHRLRTVDEERR